MVTVPIKSYMHLSWAGTYKTEFASGQFRGFYRLCVNRATL